MPKWRGTVRRRRFVSWPPVLRHDISALYLYNDDDEPMQEAGDCTATYLLHSDDAQT